MLSQTVKVKGFLEICKGIHFTDKESCSENLCALFYLNQFFFPFNFFLQQHKTIINSNNMKNNYMNQLLRLPLLK